MLQSVFRRTHITQVGMHTFSVIEQLNILKHISPYLFHCIVFSLVNLFLFQSCKENLVNAQF